MTPETKDKLKAILKTVALVTAGGAVGGSIGSLRGMTHMYDAAAKGMVIPEAIAKGVSGLTPAQWQAHHVSKGLNAAAGSMATGTAVGAGSGLMYDAVTSKNKKQAPEEKTAEYFDGFWFKACSMVDKNSPVLDVLAGAVPLAGPMAVGAVRGGGKGAARGVVGSGLGASSGAIAGGITGTALGMLAEIAYKNPTLGNKLAGAIRKARMARLAARFPSYGHVGGAMGASLGLGLGGAIGTRAATT